MLRPDTKHLPFDHDTIGRMHVEAERWWRGLNTRERVAVALQWAGPEPSPDTTAPDA